MLTARCYWVTACGGQDFVIEIFRKSTQPTRIRHRQTRNREPILRLAGRNAGTRNAIPPGLEEPGPSKVLGVGRWLYPGLEKGGISLRRYCVIPRNACPPGREVRDQGQERCWVLGIGHWLFPGFESGVILLRRYFDTSTAIRISKA